MSGDKTTRPPADDSSLELPPQIVVTARKWLVWQCGMTAEDAIKVMDCAKGYNGPTRSRQRQEAIDVADFVEHLTNAK